VLAVGKAGADPAGARDVADRARGWVRPWAGGSRAAEGRGWVAVAAGLAALLVAAVLPALALLVGAVWAGGAVTARAEAGLTDTARLFVGSFDQDYRAARLTVVTAVTRPGIRLALAHGDVGLARATLANMAATAPLADAGLYDARGRLVAQHLAAGARPLPRTAAWPAVAREGPLMLVGRHTVRQVSAPVIGSGGRRLGTVVADVDLTRVAGPTADLRLSRTGAVHVGGTNDRVIASAATSAVGVSFRAAENRQIAAAHRPRELVLFSPLYRTEVVEAYWPAPGEPWGVMVQDFSSHVFAGADAMRLRLRLLALGFGLAGAALAVTVALLIWRRDQRITAITADLRTANVELSAANEELEGFTYSVAHDMRGPLRAINSQAQILVEEHGGELDTEAGRRLSRVAVNATRLGKLVDDLLEFFLAGRGSLDMATIDMAALVTEVLREVREEQAQRPVSVSVGELAPGRGDRALIRQVWVNLLSNALKFTAGVTGPCVWVESEPGEGEVVYRVRDNGIGFDMAYADRLFKVFERLHGGEYPGTGIGLALAARIVARHGGRAWAEGRPGQGACFSFTLPTPHQQTRGGSRW